MNIFKLFVSGINTTNKKSRMIVYLWVLNFIFSLVIVSPFYFLVNKELSRSLIGEELVKGFGLTFIGDIIFKYRDIGGLFTGWILTPGIIFLILYVFLNGGIIGRIVAKNEKLNLKNFLGDCSTYFFSFLRVFLISIIAYILAFGVIFRIISSLFDLWTKNASTEWPLIISSNIKFLILILLLSVIMMFFDYAKIRLVVERSKKATRAVLVSFSFIGKRFFRAWFLYLLVGIVALIVGLIYLGISRILPPSVIFVIVVFIWQQIYILTRLWTKILFFSTEYHFFIQDKIF